MSGAPSPDTLVVRHLLAGAGSAATGPARIAIAGGRIARIDPAAIGEASPLFAMPCLVNAHDHARPVRSSSFGAGGKPLEIWLHLLALLPALDPYKASALSLARSALGGCGAVMVHHTRVQGLTDLPAEACEVARAARDVGVRVGFAVALRDRHPLVYGASEPVLAALPEPARRIVAERFLKPPRAVADQIALVEAVAEAAGGPDFDVQYGPTGPQWCSPDLLVAVARASERTGRRIHMHCLETRYQRAWADEAHPDGLLRHLDAIGLLTPRLTLAHCTHARPDELDLLAARGVTIAVNTSSNLGLRSGIAPLAEMVRRGCRVAFGLDGLALDEDDDALRELRLASLLHGGTGFSVDLSRGDALAAAFGRGRAAVLRDPWDGTLAPGAPADLLLLDWSRLDDDRLRDDLDPLDLLFARARSEHIAALLVGGRRIVADGRVLGIDLPALRDEVMAAIRGAMRHDDALSGALHSLEGAIRRSLAGETSCC